MFESVKYMRCPLIVELGLVLSSSMIKLISSAGFWRPQLRSECLERDTKMAKRILVAIAVIAFLASVVPTFATTTDSATYPPFSVYSFSPDQDDDLAIKVDGSATVRWPFDYKYLTICKIPVKMKIGMYIRVKDCDDKKIVLVQKDCEDAETVGKGAGDWPCYYGCVSIDILANFTAKIKGDFVDRTSVINGDKWSVSVTPNTIAGDGNYHTVDVCVKTWQAKIEKAAAGDEVSVGNVAIQAKPNV